MEGSTVTGGRPTLMFPKSLPRVLPSAEALLPLLGERSVLGLGEWWRYRTYPLPLAAALPFPLPLPLPVAELPSAEALFPEPVPTMDPKVEPKADPRMPVASDLPFKLARGAATVKEATRPKTMVEARIMIMVVD